MKRMITVLMAVVLLLTFSIPAFAAVEDTGFSDVSADAWYADAVAYVQDNNIMSGTSNTTFSPDAPMTRAMLATVLYRASGSPTVSGEDSFTDTSANSWYSNAVLWGSRQGIVSGYGNGLFGTNDTVNREQIATILWRYMKQPTSATDTAAFADESLISSYAVPAVRWARAAGVVNGKAENRFDPAGGTTRAEVATMLRNLLTADTGNTNPPVEKGRALVVYFSVPETTNPNNMNAEEENSTVVVNGQVLGNTQYVASLIQQNVGADSFRIEPVTPYPMNHAELEAVATEQANQKARPAIASQIQNLDQYDTIFIGYPIWYSDMPMILYSFFDQYDLSGKTIVPFVTSGASGFSSTINSIRTLEPNATVDENGYAITRNRMQDAEAEVARWLDELDYTK